MPLPAPESRPGSPDEPLISALVAERCPSCGARLASAAQWCSLCFADLRPAPAVHVNAPVATAPVASVSPPGLPVENVSPAPVTASPQVSDARPAAAADSSAPAVRPTWPCGSCGAAVDVELDACQACGTGFLGALRNSSTGIELPMVGNLGRFSDRSRIILGSVAGLLVAFVLVALTALVG